MFSWSDTEYSTVNRRYKTVALSRGSGNEINNEEWSKIKGILNKRNANPDYIYIYIYIYICVCVFVYI